MLKLKSKVRKFHLKQLSSASKEKQLNNNILTDVWKRLKEKGGIPKIKKEVKEIKGIRGNPKDQERGERNWKDKWEFQRLRKRWQILLEHV